MAQTFQTKIRINFHHADPAGIMFFAHIFTLAHDCFESFVQAAGFSWENFFLNKKMLTPIRHTECDYLRPLQAGLSYDVSVAVEKISGSSFQLSYTFSKTSTVHAIVKMVHTCLEASTFAKIDIPTDLKQKLFPYLKEAAT